MPPFYGAYVNFTAPTSYQQALVIETDLGLKTFAHCHPAQFVPQKEPAASRCASVGLLAPGHAWFFTAATGAALTVGMPEEHLVRPQCWLARL